MLIYASSSLVQVQSVVVTCIYNGNSQYACEFKNTNFVNTEEIIITGTHLTGYRDNEVLEVLTTGSFFDFIPMEIFDKFQNLITVN